MCVHAHKGYRPGYVWLYVYFVGYLSSLDQEGHCGRGALRESTRSHLVSCVCCL